MIYNNNKINLFLRYFIALCIITVLIYYVQSQEDILRVLDKFNIHQLIPALLVIILHLVFLYLSWRVIVKKIGCINPKEKYIAHSFLGGRALGIITPAQSGELLKGFFFNSENRNVVTSLSFIYAAYELIVRTMLGCIGIVYLIYNRLLFYNYNKYLVTMLVILFILAAAIVILLKNRNLIEVLFGFVPKQVLELFKLLKHQIQNTSLLWFFNITLLILIANSLAALAFMLILTGFNINSINLDGYMAYATSYMMMSLLPITPAGIGINEGSRVYFFSLIGCSPATVLWASFIMFGLNIICPAIIGIWSLRYFWRKPPQIT